MPSALQARGYFFGLCELRSELIESARTRHDGMDATKMLKAFKNKYEGMMRVQPRTSNRLT